MAAPAPLVSIFLSVLALFAGGRDSVTTAGSRAGLPASAIGSLLTGSGNGSVFTSAVVTGSLYCGTTCGTTGAGVASAATDTDDAGRVMTTLFPSAAASRDAGQVRCTATPLRRDATSVLYSPVTQPTAPGRLVQ